MISKQNEVEIFTQIRRQRRKFVNMLASIRRKRNAEPEFKIESLQHLIPEEMPFDHPESIHRPASNRKLDPINKKFKNIP